MTLYETVKQLDYNHGFIFRQGTSHYSLLLITSILIVFAKCQEITLHAVKEYYFSVISDFIIQKALTENGRAVRYFLIN